MKRVVLFKSPENSEEYVDVFEKNGFKPVFLPVLEFKFINLDNLLQKLKANSHYEGLVVTSQRAVEAIVECLKEEIEDLMVRWRRKAIFVVGGATNNKLNKELSLQGTGEHCGNAATLADFIIKQNEEMKLKLPLLFPCGNLKSEVLPDKLGENMIELDSTVVYITQQDTSLRQKLINLQQDCGIPLNLIFFSPSGVSFVLPILEDIGFNFANCNLIAIGPSTEKKIMEMGYKTAATAKEPTAQGIFSCFDSIGQISN